MMESEERGRAVLTGGRVAWSVLAGLVLLHIALAILLFDPKPFVGGDNAGYMILAESLETGQGYHNIHLPGSPRHTQYPPLYPAILAVTMALGGGLIAFKVISILFTSLSVLLAFLLARGRLGWVGGLAVAAPFALNPVLLYYSHWVLSEAAFVMLTLAALLASERFTESRWLGLTIAGALLAYLTRAAGLPLVVALLLALAWRRRWRDLAIAGAASVVVLGGWWTWGKVVARDSAQVYSSNFLMVDPYNPAQGWVGPGELLARTVNNIRLYAVDVLPQSLAGVTPGGGLSLMALLAGLLILALALIAWVRGVREKRVLELFTAFYAGLIFLWPAVWTDRRFLLPLLPVLLLLAASGVNWCFDFAKTRAPSWALPAAAALLVLLAMPGHVRTVEYSQRCMRLYRAGDTLACYPRPWRAFVEAADWTRENTAQDVIVVNRKPRLFYYFARRRGDVYPFTSEDDEMLAFLDEIEADYVVIAGLSGTTFRYLVPVINSVPNRFRVAHTVGDAERPDAWVLEYVRESAAQPQEGR